MKNMGFKIQGSDQNKIKTQQVAQSLELNYLLDTQLIILRVQIVVKSSAIKDNNVEIKYAKK